MSYHTREIKKGIPGELSKIKEEFEEVLDAEIQEDRLLILCELADIVGAIDLYVKKHHDMSIDEIVTFAKKTNESFKSGKRT